MSDEPSAGREDAAELAAQVLAEESARQADQRSRDDVAIVDDALLPGM